MVALAALAAAVLFSLWPRIDLLVSGLFYVRGAGFPLADDPVAVALRRTIWWASDAMVIAALAGLVLAAAGRAPFHLGGRIWGFVLLLYALGPGIVVNLGLKNTWGRARPADVLEFGGSRTFTPALRISDQCASNCSFVSGEGAAAAALSISAAVILWNLRHRLPASVLRGGLAACLVVGLTGSALRVMAGRHFLSDTVFAVLIVAALALALHRLLFGASDTGAPRDPGRR